MGKQILTLDNLYQFFVQQNKTVNFNAKESGQPIVVRTDGYFEAEDNDMPGMLKLKLKVCHTETNRNGSHISEANMEKAMPTLKYRPILAYIHELEDGTKDFYAHNMEVIENEDGESEIIYIEKQVGCFTADNPWLEYDKDMDKTYVKAYAVIPEDYTETADIIRRKNGTKVSCELVIDELSYNAKEKYLDLTSFYFGACTLLGKDENGNDVGEGMLGARADIEAFCHKEPTYNYQDKLVETLEKLNYTLENFHKDSTQKGGNEMNKFEELLAKYGKTAEDVTFEIEGLSDEELEAKFVEAFEDTGDDTFNNDVTDDDEGNNTDDEGNDNDDDNQDNEGSVDEKFTKTFTVELSHDDIRNALYNLVRQYESDDEYYYIREVFDSYFYMEDWYSGSIYRQSYIVDGENVALDGDRVEVFEILVSKEEKEALDALKENYSALEAKYNELAEFKSKYDADTLKAQKDAIFAKDEYECLNDTDGFKALIADAEKYSVDEVVTKADLLFAAYVKSTGEFSVKKSAVKPTSMKFSVETVDKGNSQPYGSLFDTK